MASDNELLGMSSNVYDAADVNRAPVPLGWTYLSEGSRTFYDPAGKAGFSAGAFINPSGTEIVISFAGAQDVWDLLDAGEAAIGNQSEQGERVPGLAYGSYEFVRFAA